MSNLWFGAYVLWLTAFAMSGPLMEPAALPLLQEHHYGEWESVRGHYRLDALMSAIAPADQEIADESVQAVAEADETGS